MPTDALTHSKRKPTQKKHLHLKAFFLLLLKGVIECIGVFFLNSRTYL